MRRGLWAATGLSELQKWTGCMGLGKNSGVCSPWNAADSGVGCCGVLMEGDRPAESCEWEEIGVRGAEPSPRPGSGGTPSVMGLGMGFCLEDVDVAEDVLRERCVLLGLESWGGLGLRLLR